MLHEEHKHIVRSNDMEEVDEDYKCEALTRLEGRRVNDDRLVVVVQAGTSEKQEEAVAVWSRLGVATSLCTENT